MRTRGRAQALPGLQPGRPPQPGPPASLAGPWAEQEAAAAEPLVVIAEADGEIMAAAAPALLRSGFRVCSAGPVERLPFTPSLMIAGLQAAAARPALVEQLRQLGRPILLVVPPDGVEAGLAALESWADDMMQAPANPRELVARVRAVLRRTDGRRAPSLAVLGYRIDAIRRLLTTPDGVVIRLTPQQTGVLAMLANTPGVVMSRETLSSAVCRQGIQSSPRAIDNQVSRLRRKLEASGQPPLIRTAYGQGYSIATVAARRAQEAS